MATLRFLADMNISPKTVRLLQEQGWDILRVSEVLPSSAKDLEVLAFARRKQRVVITQDLDFSVLLALSGYSSPSLVTLRLPFPEPETVARRLLEVVPQVESFLLRGCAVTVEEHAVRIRRLPIEL